MSILMGLCLSMPLIGDVRGDYITFRLKLYLSSLGLYHWVEYLYVCLYHYDKLHFDSNTLFFDFILFLGFLLNQSWAYMSAMAISFLEYFVTQVFFTALDPYNYIESTKIKHSIMTLGLIMMAIGHYFRISAEMTAGRNFNH